MRARLLVMAFGLGLVLAACGTGPETTAPARSGVTDPQPSDGSMRVERDYPAGSLGAFLANADEYGTFLALMESDAFLLNRLHADPERGFTLFLPTNDAFLLLDARTKDALSSDQELITGIVERHFLPRRLAAEEFVSGYLFTGMSRRASRLALVVDGDRLWFGDGLILAVDLPAGGGIVHVIDGVNLGPTPDRQPIP